MWNRKLFYIFGFLLFVFLPFTTYSATLTVTPNSTSVSVGNIFTVNLIVNTEGKIINNVETEIQFPKDFLEVVSIDKTSSIFTLWVSEPTFSNILGNISFNAGIPNPGYQGINGKVLSVVFRARKAGNASIVLLNSAVRENDGLGTDILSNRVGSSLIIRDTVAEEPVVSPPIQISNAVLVVTSSTHPNQDSWYNNNDVELSWKIPKDATSVKTLLGSFPNSNTSVLYNTPLKNKSISNLSDGVWYFHVNYLGSNGWSPVTHFRLQVDTTSPKDLSVDALTDQTGRLSINIKAVDTLSGIDYYTVAVDSNPSFIIEADENGIGKSNIPVTSVGSHSIVVRAYDKAGNVLEKIISLTTDTIVAVSIDSYPVKIKVGENIEISGTAPYTGAKVLVYLRKGDTIFDNHEITANSYSKFDFKSQIIDEAGIYTAWVEVLNPNGSVASSQKVNINVIKPIMLQVGSYTTELLSVLVPSIVLLLILLLALYYGWYKFFVLRNRFRKDFDRMHARVHRAFRLLSTETTKQLTVLEKARRKTKLSSEEQDIIDELKDSVEQIDLYVETQLKKIEDDNLK